MQALTTMISRLTRRNGAAGGQMVAGDGAGEGRSEGRSDGRSLARVTQALGPARRGDSFMATEMPGTRTAHRRRRLWPFALVLVPTLLGVLYFGLMAADQYTVESRFALRSREGQGMDPIGLMIGLPASQSGTDGYLLVDYIRSRDIVEQIDREFNLRAMFSAPNGDILTRARADYTIEELTEYWRQQLSVRFDSSSGVVVVRIRAFAAQDALKISERVLALSEALVNQLSGRARADAVRNADEDVARMEQRLRAARRAIQLYREQTNVIDVTRTAGSRQEIVNRLQGEIVQLNAELKTFSTYNLSNSPGVNYLKTRLQVLETQLAQIKNERLPNEPRGVSELIANFQDLETEQQFAEKAYTAAMASLERARAEADRQSRYVVVAVNPRLPQSPLYPERLKMIIVIAIASGLITGVIMMLTASIKDHVH
jgi:capsular polysaccharide transport system permease protein